MNESNLEKIITNCFVKLKEEFYSRYTIEEYEDDTNPQILSMRDVIEALPPPSIQVIEIINDSIESKHKKGFVFRYDYTQRNSNKIEFHGSVSTKDIQLIQSVCGKLNAEEREIKFLLEQVLDTFMNTATWEPTENWCLQFIAGDVEEDSDLFYHEWQKWAIWNHMDVPGLSEKFQRERFQDFNKLYGLENDPLLSFSDITKPNGNMDSFGLNLESLQKSIAHIQLIPKVPKDIKTTFERVKKLHIYGYFEYSFFTLAQHYAYFALESAIKHRYIQSLDGKAILYNPKKNIEKEMVNPSHFNIVKFCRDVKGWNEQTVQVNGKDFPSGSNQLLDWLEKNHLIRKWEKGIFEAGIKLRNFSAHQEQIEVHMPSANLLHIIANQINHIFHQEIK